MEIILVGLAVFYVTSVLLNEYGPYGVFFKIRERVESSVVDCFVCASFWVALLFSAFFADNLLQWALYTLASAGIATFLYNVE
jgi:ABC-type arginine transport system permease subunit